MFVSHPLLWIGKRSMSWFPAVKDGTVNSHAFSHFLSCLHIWISDDYRLILVVLSVVFKPLS